MYMWRTCGKFSQKDPENSPHPMQPNVCGALAKDGLALLTLAPPFLLRSWVLMYRILEMAEESLLYCLQSTKSWGNIITYGDDKRSPVS